MVSQIWGFFLEPRRMMRRSLEACDLPRMLPSDEVYVDGMTLPLFGWLGTSGHGDDGDNLGMKRVLKFSITVRVHLNIYLAFFTYFYALSDKSFRYPRKTPRPFSMCF